MMAKKKSKITVVLENGILSDKDKEIMKELGIESSGRILSNSRFFDGKGAEKILNLSKRKDINEDYKDACITLPEAKAQKSVKKAPAKAQKSVDAKTLEKKIPVKAGA